MHSERQSSDDLLAREIDARIVVAVEDERQRIASELHDNFGQELTGALIVSQQLSDKLSELGSPAYELATHLVAINSRLASETQRLSNILKPAGFLEIGLDFALNALADGIKSIGMPCQFTGTAKCDSIDPSASLHLFRIAQEAVNNAVKHSGADQVHIQLANDSDEDGSSDVISMSIIDNGIGHEKVLAKPGHAGLANMQRHARLIGGTLTISGNDANGKGTTVTCRVERKEISFHGQTK